MKNQKVDETAKENREWSEQVATRKEELYIEKNANNFSDGGMASHLGISVPEVREIRRKNYVHKRKSYSKKLKLPVTDEDLKEVLNNSGYSIANISFMIGISETEITKYVKRCGIRIERSALWYFNRAQMKIEKTCVINTNEELREFFKSMICDRKMTRELIRKEMNIKKKVLDRILKLLDIKERIEIKGIKVEKKCGYCNKKIIRLASKIRTKKGQKIIFCNKKCQGCFTAAHYSPQSKNKQE